MTDRRVKEYLINKDKSLLQQLSEMNLELVDIEKEIEKIKARRLQDNLLDDDVKRLHDLYNRKTDILNAWKKVRNDEN